MKFIKFTIILILFSSAIRGQETFSYIYPENTSAIVFELEDNRYAVILPDSLIIFSQQGEIIESRTFSSPGRVFKTETGKIIGIGLSDYIPFSHFYIRIIEYDNELNPIAEKKHYVEAKGRKIERATTTITNNGEGIFIIRTVNKEWRDRNTKAYKIDFDSETIIASLQYPELINNTYNSIIEMGDNNYYMIGQGESYSVEIIVLDINLHYKEKYSVESLSGASGHFPVIVYSDIMRFSDNQYLFTSNYQFFETYDTGTDIGIAKADTLKNMISQNTIEEVEEMGLFYPAASQSISFIDTSNIFWGGQIYIIDNF